MTGDVVNLRAARKAKARATAGTIATGNRAKFGRTKAERQHDAAVAARLAATMDGAKRER